MFHGVTARNVCELLHSIHGNDFKYVGLDLFGESIENANEVIPNTKFNNPLKKIYFEYILVYDDKAIDGIYNYGVVGSDSCVYVTGILIDLFNDLKNSV